MGLYGIAFWLPQLINGLTQQSLQQTGWLTAIPYACAGLAMIAVGHSSDKHHERCWHFAVCTLLGSAGLVLSAQLNDGLAFSLTALSLACAGILSALPVFWSIPTQLFNGVASAGGIALINSFGNLAGYLSPVAVAWLKETTGNLTSALYMLAGCLALSAVIVVVNFNQGYRPGRQSLTGLNKVWLT